MSPTTSPTHADPVTPYEIRAARYQREVERTRHARRFADRKHHAERNAR